MQITARRPPSACVAHSQVISGGVFDVDIVVAVPELELELRRLVLESKRHSMRNIQLFLSKMKAADLDCSIAALQMSRRAFLLTLAVPSRPTGY